MKALFSLIFFLVCLSSQSFAQSNCLNQQLAMKLAQNFSWKEEKQPGVLSPLSIQDLTSLKNLCDRSKPETKVLEAMMYMDYLTFSDTPLDRFDQGILRDPVFSFFKEKVQIMVFVRDGVPCDAAAYFTNKDTPPTVRVCPVIRNGSAYSIFSLLLHEARHRDVGPHTLCTRGPYIGTDMCDRSYQDKNSYAVTVEASVKLARNYQVPESVRATAREEAYVHSVWHFNELPFQMRKGIALIDESGEVYFYDGKTLEKHRHLKYPHHTWVQDEALRTTALKTSLYDVTSIQGRLCTLSDSRSATCTGRDQIPKTLRSEQIQASSRFGRIQFLQKDGSIDVRLVIIGPDSDKVLLFGQYFKMNAGDAVESKANPQSFKDTLVFNDDTSFGLTKDGTVHKFTYWGDKTSPVPALQGKRFQRMLGPIYSSKDLEGI